MLFSEIFYKDIAVVEVGNLIVLLKNISKEIFRVIDIQLNIISKYARISTNQFVSALPY